VCQPVPPHLPSEVPGNTFAISARDACQTGHFAQPSIFVTLCIKILTRPTDIIAAYRPSSTGHCGGALHFRAKETAMGDSDDIRQMSDPDFLAERARVRETIAALTERMAELDDEFINRARAAWAEAVK
jgi:hypothetical protein